ncbi:MAG: hypothetical protein ACW99U_19630 [Candidatus Thorarchaeota archaeon]|jgi:hypothetical protein
MKAFGMFSESGPRFAKIVSWLCQLISSIPGGLVGTGSKVSVERVMSDESLPVVRDGSETRRIALWNRRLMLALAKDLEKQGKKAREFHRVYEAMWKREARRDEHNKRI